jgi:hypothetical protein
MFFIPPPLYSEEYTEWNFFIPPPREHGSYETAGGTAARLYSVTARKQLR